MKGGFDLNSIMKNMQNFKGQIDNVKKEMENKTAEGSAGGGMVKAIVSGALKVKKIIISDEMLAEKDKEMLEEMIVVAVNDGLNRIEEMNKDEMSKLASTMGIPLNGLM
jgi:hypothetical protein